VTPICSGYRSTLTLPIVITSGLIFEFGMLNSEFGI
jgi:hypothetical protein